MLEILNYIYVPLAVVFLFGAAVFVHEFGHFWVALKCGLKVEGFAIGFGPKIVSWTRNGIEYSLRWIPAGGFVKLPQMVTSEMIEGEGHKSIPPADPIAKILVAAAGPFMNMVFAFAIASLIYFVGLPVPVNPSIVGYVEPNSAEEKLGIKPGDRIISVDGKLAKSWQDVQMASVLALTNVLPVVIERDGKRQTYQLSAKVSDIVGLKILNLDPKDHPVVRMVEAKGAAAAAGLQLNDEFISFGGVPILSQDQLIGLIRKRPNEATEVVIKRGEEKLKLSVTPAVDPTTKLGRMGVALGTSATTLYEIQHPLPWTQIADVWNRTIDTFRALFHSKQTGVGAKDLSGPVGILTLLAIWVNTDYRLALNFLVLLNVNLAILNMMPIPVLDGGHIAMSILEKIRRKPLSARVVEYSTTAFAVLLISFMLYVTFFDIKRFPLFQTMFKHKSQFEQQKSDPASNR